MARYTGPVCRLCRREGTKLVLKGTRCLTQKGAGERRAHAPAPHSPTPARRPQRPGGHHARVRLGEEVRVADASRELVLVKIALEQFGRGQPVSWIQVDTDKVLGKMTERPTRDAIPIAAQEQLIVELYSK